MAALVARGRVAGVWRWPVKSLGGERVAAARLDHRGLAGDRAHLLVDPDSGRVITARQAPRMLRWSAAYPGAQGQALAPGRVPAPVLTDPGGREWRWDDPTLAGELAADLAPEPPATAPAGAGQLRPVALATEPAGQQDLPGTVLVTTAASLSALEAELGGAAGTLDLRRFRTNLHLELDAPAFAEQGWEGMTLTLAGPGGEQARIELLHPCKRCAIPTRDPDTAARWPRLLRHLVAGHAQRFGINTRSAGPGLAAEGAAVTVTAP
jgi:uncharacterized protein YcbX